MTYDIYLDANATSPVLPAAIAAAADAMDGCYGNPSSGHATGLRAKVLLDGARERARRMIGAGTGRVIFNSGATEGIQTAVLSALCAVRERQAAGETVGDLLLYGATEHKAVPEALAHWNRLLGTGLTLRVLPVDGEGRHRLDVLRQLAPRAAMVCTMAANNETGTISDLAAIEKALLVGASKAYWMVDSVQALGKLPLALDATRIDYAPFSGHKLYAPKGIGMLYVRDGAPYTALMAGGGQEGGQRAGTENMAGIAALGAVLAALEAGDTFRTLAQLHAYRDRLVASLREALPGIVLNTPLQASLPTTINFSVEGLSGRDLLDVFDAAGLRVSAGSACSAAKAAPSYVLEAMGLADWRCASAVRLSFGPAADDAFIDAACERIAHCGRAMFTGGLVPPALRHEGQEDVVRLGHEGASTWLALDEASRSCVVIDPVAALGERIASMVRSRDYRVRGIIGTSSGSDQLSVRAALAALLGEQVDFTGTGDPFGWPAGSGSVRLGDETQTDGIALGGQVLARVSHDGDATRSYLMGASTGGALQAGDVRFAFTSAASGAQQMTALLNGDTIVCPSHDSANLICTTPTAATRLAPSLDAMELRPADLDRFLRERPDAILVDVRDPWEHEAGRPVIHGRTASNVPLSRLPSQLAQWLGVESRPLVFICRLGTRSQRAAQCLHRAGYAQAWHLGGGLALHFSDRKTDLSRP
ncbi:aminotransferase class V-fold PLP-dependent enzyme [Massilia sp. GCM10020059]|uniref:cysteine desulfurase n=1 Tax=Massilia agrisoli TaxID=2892444 RepID=A0ABS8IY23_9BURK|nr:aminotransferase class V-fold PLP-dependent enzyme [Massilia agrisoli]MCC6073505.1 aminotransferase class V-fold PLP-dependent enzyme [Massilia agrisoli]